MSAEAPVHQASNVTTGHNASRRAYVFGITANSATMKYPNMGGRACETNVMVSIWNIVETK